MTWTTCKVYSSGTQRRVVWFISTQISDEVATSFFCIAQEDDLKREGINFAPKHCAMYTNPKGVIQRKILIAITNGVRKSNSHKNMYLFIYRRFCVSHYTECSGLRNKCHRPNTVLKITFSFHLPPVQIYKDPSHQQRMNDVVRNQNFSSVQKPVSCVWERIRSQRHRCSLHNLTRQL